MTRGVFRLLNGQWVPLRQQGKSLPRLQLRRLSSEIVAAPPPVPANFVDDETEPTAFNTGHAGPLTRLDGDVTLSTPGAVLENREVYGFVTVAAANVTIRNCYIRGREYTVDSDRGLVTCLSSSVRNLNVERTTLRPDFPTGRINGIQGHHWRMYRCDVSRVVDPARAHWPANPNQESGIDYSCNYLHDIMFVTPWPSQSDNRTHNDIIQIEDGLNIKVHGNATHGFMDPEVSSPSNLSNASGKGNGLNILCNVQVTPNVGRVDGLQIYKNWMYGATLKVQIAQKGRGVINNLRIYDNRVADDGTSNAFSICATSTQTANVATWTGNTWTTGSRAGQTITAGNNGFFARADD